MTAKNLSSKMFLTDQTDKFSFQFCLVT